MSAKKIRHSGEDRATAQESKRRCKAVGEFVWEFIAGVFWVIVDLRNIKNGEITYL